MSEIPPQQEQRFNSQDTELGIVGDPPEILVLTIPIGTYVRDRANGAALVYGKIREAQAEAMRIFTILRQRQDATGVIKPPPTLKVN